MTRPKPIVTTLSPDAPGVREMRLQQLLAEFEAWKAQWLSFGMPALSVDQFAKWNPIEHAGEHHRVRNELLKSARRYIIARDFPNSSDADWEFLWKLTHGGSL